MKIVVLNIIILNAQFMAVWLTIRPVPRSNPGMALIILNLRRFLTIYFSILNQVSKKNSRQEFLIEISL